jgi:hypothetical protein
LSSVAAGVIGAVATVTTSIFVYIHQRRKIPILSFNGYFKTERPLVTGNVHNQVTTYCVRVEDVNPKTEGKIESCAGSIVVANDTYRTVLMFSNQRHQDFVKEAWLKLFDVNSKDETIGLFNTPEELNAKRASASYGRRIGDSITMQLEAARGNCPKPHIENIEYIINNAQFLV